MKTCKTYRILTLLGVFTWFGSFSANAQQDSIKTSGLGINLLFQPLFIGIQAIKLDLEIQKPKSRFAYVISPEIYSGMTQDYRSNRRQEPPEDRISGFGIGVHQKLKFKKEPVSHYFAYGLTYRYNKITYESEGFNAYQENGLNYYGYGPSKNDMKINSILVSGVIGFQDSYWDILLTDAYVGFGYKLPGVQINDPGQRQYDRYYMSPAFKGVLILVGVKIGVQIKK
jgi:hypothetical protein